MKRFLSALLVFTAIVGVSACNAEQSNLAVSDSISTTVNVPDFVQTTGTSTAISSESLTDTALQDPWLAVKDGISNVETLQQPLGDFYSVRTFFEASKACSVLRFDYFNTSDKKIGTGYFVVYPNEDDFEINFKFKLLNKDRLPFLLETIPYIPQDIKMYKLTYDSDAEFGYEYQFNAYRWHLENFPSAESIKSWAIAWKNGEAPVNFFTLKPNAEVYFKAIGADSQKSVADRQAAYVGMFSEQDPYFVDKSRGIEYHFGVNEAQFDVSHSTVSIPYLRICDITDEADTFCDISYAYNNSEFEFVPDDWLNDYRDTSVSDYLETEINPGEMIMGYIVMPYRGTGIYTFKSVHGGFVKFIIYDNLDTMTSTEKAINLVSIVNENAAVDFDAVYETADYVCDTRNLSVCKDDLYTSADVAALSSYYKYAQASSAYNIWIQMQSNPRFLWQIRDDVPYLFHIATPDGDPAYMLEGELVWAILARSIYSETAAIDAKGGIDKYMAFYNERFNLNLKLVGV